MKHVNRQWDVTQLVEQLILTANIHSLNPVTCGQYYKLSYNRKSLRYAS